MFYYYFALALHSFLIIFTLLTIKFTTKELKLQSKTNSNPTSKNKNISQTKPQKRKLKIFGYLMKQYTLINLITDFKFKRILILMTTYSLFSLFISLSDIWFLSPLVGILITVPYLILELFQTHQNYQKLIKKKIVELEELKLRQNICLYIGAGAMALGIYLFLLSLLYQNQIKIANRDLLIYLGISTAIDSLFTKPILFLILTFIFEENKDLLTLASKQDKIISNQLSNQYNHTNESEAKINDQIIANGLQILKYQQFQKYIEEDNKQIRTNKKSIQKTNNKSNNKFMKEERQQIYYEPYEDNQNVNNMTIEDQKVLSVHKQNTILSIRDRKQRKSINIMNLSQAKDQNYQKIMIQNIQNQTTPTQLGWAGMATQNRGQKRDGIRNRRRRRTQNVDNFKQTKQRIISIYSDTRRGSFINSKRGQETWHSKRHHSTNRSKPIAHEVPTTVDICKITQFKISEHL